MYIHEGKSCMVACILLLYSRQATLLKSLITDIAADVASLPTTVLLTTCSRT